ncbi:MAG TPA: hypothetical protein VJ919_01340, partial [Tangfeifania sp.]|nr:hypothetical protein [Tangfeifania sp.]
ISALWEYGNSALQVKIEGGNTFHTAFPFQAAFAARFEKASVLFSPTDTENITVATDTTTKQVPVGDPNEGFAGELDYFVSCVTENKQPEKCTPESALESVDICYRHINNF